LLWVFRLFRLQRRFQAISVHVFEFLAHFDSKFYSGRMAEDQAVPVVTVPAIRVDWYQTETHVTIEIMVKKVDPNISLISITPKNVKLIILFYNPSQKVTCCSFR